MKTTARMRHHVSVAALAMLLASPWSGRAWAQAPSETIAAAADLSELSLEELADLNIDSVYGASMYLQKVTEAPSSVTIITADQIERYGYRTLADALRSVRGFYITNDRNYSYLGVRGFSRPGDYNARILLLIDGHRLNDNIFGSALLGTEFPLDVELIQRIEIIRGPSSSLYGTSAFFGVINVITKRGSAVKGLEASVGGGTHNARRGRASYGQAFGNGVSLLLSGSAYTADGQPRLYYPEFDSPETNNGIAQDVDADEANHLFASMSAGRFTLQGLYGSREKAVPTASFGTVFNDPRSSTTETFGYVTLQYDRPLPGAWQLASRANFNRYLYDGSYVFDHAEDGPPELVVNRDGARGDWWGGEAKLSRKLAARHTLALGAEYRDNLRQDQFNYDDGLGTRYLSDERTSSSWALFAQDEIALHRRLLLNIGLRHDHYDTFGGTTNPRLALIYSPIKTTSLKFLYGQAFRAPNAYEMYYHQTDIAKANLRLQPETNRASEVVLEQYVGTRVRVTTTGFYSRVHDLITQQTDPEDNLLIYNNLDAITAHGVETEVEGKWPRGLEGKVAYTYQNSRNDGTGLALTNSPKHLTQLNLIAPFIAEHLFTGLELRHMSSRQTISGGTVDDVFVANVTFFTRGLPKHLQLTTTLFNLFDNQYGDPGSEEHRQDSIRQNGRSIRVKLTIKLPRIG